MAIYTCHYNHEFRRVGGLTPQPWDQPTLQGLTQVVQFCSHFSSSSSLPELQKASSALDAGEALYKFKKNAVNVALASTSTRHLETKLMQAEDRLEQLDRTMGGQAGLEMHARNVAEAQKELQKAHVEPMKALSSFNFFHSTWQMALSKGSGTAD